jgi:potassium-transporting ATPase KdpC subunit
MATRLPSWLRQHLAAVRALLVLTVLVGLAYPLVITGVAQIPGLKSKADGSLVTAGGRDVGSSLIGQAFTDDKGDAIPKYFQSRPSAAGDGYDPTSTSASNLGPESIVDTPDDPATAEDDSKPSLLTQVCTRSLAIGTLEGVDGSRPYCTPGGVGAVLAVFHVGPGYAGAVTRAVSVNEYCDTTPTPFLATYQGVAVECHKTGDDVTAGQLVPVRGNAPAVPAVPADAVTASGSGLDPDISPAYADLQAARVAKVRNLPVDRVQQLIRKHTEGRGLGFLGEPGVNVLQLNLELDRVAPVG